MCDMPMEKRKGCKKRPGKDCHQATTDLSDTLYFVFLSRPSSYAGTEARTRGILRIGQRANEEVSAYFLYPFLAPTPLIDTSCLGGLTVVFPFHDLFSRLRWHGKLRLVSERAPPRGAQGS